MGRPSPIQAPPAADDPLYRRAGARRDLDAFLEGNPRSFDGLYSRGICVLRLGDPAGAERDLRRALELAPPRWQHDEEARAALRSIAERDR